MTVFDLNISPLVNDPRPLDEKLRERCPRQISVFVDFVEVLRIVDGKRIIDRPVDENRQHWFLTIHFDGSTEREYMLLLADPLECKET